MGGHQSKQTVGVSALVAANVVQNTTQNCINVMYGDNVITVNGNYNVISGVNQSVSISIDSTCSTMAAQDSTFQADLEAAVSQSLSDQEQAMTSWMDNSGDDQGMSFKQSVTTNFTQTTVQNCVNTLNGTNILNINGSGNVVKDIVQTSTLNLISQCLLGNEQTTKTIVDITDTANQQGVYKSESPFAFLGDAFEAVAGSAIKIMAIIFIVIISFVFIIQIIKKSKKSSSKSSAYPMYPMYPTAGTV